ncbi:hypothetical protein FPRO04_07531 [Fusarium proliferatum]|nr:hypothetical protein FPRO04_07531 [Fusarium proliferatum]
MVLGQPPDPSSCRVWDVYSRRRFIYSYLEYLSGDATTKWDTCLKMAFETVMESLKEKGLTQVNHYWLEYEADYVAWQKISNELDIEAIDSPFVGQCDGSNNIEEGTSPTYQKWRLDRDLPIYDEPGCKKSMELSLAQRKIVWDDNPNYPRHTEPPITGPFQIALPLWIDVDNLVLGEDDRLLNSINKEIVPPHLAVSLHKDDEGCITLVVGFSPTTCIFLGDDEVIDRSIRYLWQNVVEWAIDTYHGGTITLATFLRVCKAFPLADDNDYHNRGVIDMTSDLWEEVQNNPKYFMARAQENREFIAKCRAEVLEIIQKPLAEAKAELSRWVCHGNRYCDRPAEAAREICVSSTTDERTVQEAVIWAMGPQEMAV